MKGMFYLFMVNSKEETKKGNNFKVEKEGVEP